MKKHIEEAVNGVDGQTLGVGHLRAGEKGAEDISRTVYQAYFFFGILRVCHVFFLNIPDGKNIAGKMRKVKGKAAIVRFLFTEC